MDSLSRLGFFTPRRSRRSLTGSLEPDASKLLIVSMTDSIPFDLTAASMPYLMMAEASASPLSYSLDSPLLGASLGLFVMAEVSGDVSVVVLMALWGDLVAISVVLGLSGVFRNALPLKGGTPVSNDFEKSCSLGIGLRFSFLAPGNCSKLLSCMISPCYVFIIPFVL